MATDSSKPNNRAGVGIAIGVGIGAALGAAFDQLALGVARGTAFGALIDVYPHLKRKRGSSSDPEAEGKN
jgi:hypothetical protein